MTDIGKSFYVSPKWDRIAGVLTGPICDGVSLIQLYPFHEMNSLCTTGVLLEFVRQPNLSITELIIGIETKFKVKHIGNSPLATSFANYSIRELTIHWMHFDGLHAFVASLRTNVLELSCYIDFNQVNEGIISATAIAMPNLRCLDMSISGYLELLRGEEWEKACIDKMRENLPNLRNLTFNLDPPSVLENEKKKELLMLALGSVRDLRNLERLEIESIVEMHIDIESLLQI